MLNFFGVLVMKRHEECSVRASYATQKLRTLNLDYISNTASCHESV